MIEGIKRLILCHWKTSEVGSHQAASRRLFLALYVYQESKTAGALR
jgi:hypothetical protein